LFAVANFPRKERPTMSPDILIIYDQAGFHLLHGHLHLAMALNDTRRTAIDVPEFGTVPPAG
jgi:calcineurin-like phosphoesterase family protein